MRLRFLLIAALVAIPAVAFAACGGDDDDATPSTTAQPTSAAASTGQVSSGSTPGGSSTQSVAGTLSGSGADDFKKLTADLAKKTYQATYDFSTTGAGQPFKGTLTIAQKPPQTAYKFASAPGSVALDFTAISNATDSYFCLKAGTDGYCTKSGAADSPFGALASLGDIESLLGDLGTNTQITETKGASIAGRDGRCFDIKSTGSDASVPALTTACFDKKDGILLQTEVKDMGSAGTGVSVKATKVDSSVDSSLFNPPYKIQDTAGIPGLTGSPTAGR